MYLAPNLLLANIWISFVNINLRLFMRTLSSRIHKLHHFPNEGVQCFVKRDDESGCGISGSKLRKYSSIVPYLLAKKITHLIIIAGPQSNNLLAALQVARELQLCITVFLLKPHVEGVQGNYKLSRLFLEEREIIWVERKEWPQVEVLAQSYLKSLDQSGYILTEGSSVLEALPGAMTLGDDIVTNEIENNITFDHIFVDAGTGFTAIALINRLHQLKHRALIHVLLLADKKDLFEAKLKQWVSEPIERYECFYPTNAKSFGSVNQTIKNEVKRMAREEGILADPIYAAKLFYEARIRIESLHLKGKVLIIHSGGTLTMPAFDY